jgi:hypothetical protein
MTRVAFQGVLAIADNPSCADDPTTHCLTNAHTAPPLRAGRGGAACVPALTAIDKEATLKSQPADAYRLAAPPTRHVHSTRRKDAPAARLDTEIAAHR